MLTLPRKLMFAIEAVTDIARQPLDRPVPSRDITSRQGIPPVSYTHLTLPTIYSV